MPESTRGQHPDLNEDGSLKPDAHLPAGERDFERGMADPSEQARLTAQIARRQELLPPEVQAFVGNRTYAPDGTVSDGYRAYQEEVRWACQNYAERQGKRIFITDTELARMTPEQLDAVLDEKGQPHSDVLLWYTRAQRLDDGLPGSTASELRSRR